MSLSIDIDSLDKKLRHIVDSFKGSLSDVGIKNVSDFINVQEYKLALEVLCDILHEDNIAIPADIYIRIAEVGELLRVESAYWKDLTSLIIKG